MPESKAEQELNTAIWLALSSYGNGISNIFVTQQHIMKLVKYALPELAKEDGLVSKETGVGTMPEQTTEEKLQSLLIDMRVYKRTYSKIERPLMRDELKRRILRIFTDYKSPEELVTRQDWGVQDGKI